MKTLDLNEVSTRILMPGEKKVSLVKNNDILDKLNKLDSILTENDIKLSYSEMELIKEQKSLNDILVQIENKEIEQIQGNQRILELEGLNHQLKTELLNKLNKDQERKDALEKQKRSISIKRENELKRENEMKVATTANPTNSSDSDDGFVELFMVVFIAFICLVTGGIFFFFILPIIEGIFEGIGNGISKL